LRAVIATCEPKIRLSWSTNIRSTAKEVLHAARDPVRGWPAANRLGAETARVGQSLSVIIISCSRRIVGAEMTSERLDLRESVAVYTSSVSSLSVEYSRNITSAGESNLAKAASNPPPLAVMDHEYRPTMQYFGPQKVLTPSRNLIRAAVFAQRSRIT